MEIARKREEDRKRERERETKRGMSNKYRGDSERDRLVKRGRKRS